MSWRCWKIFPSTICHVGTVVEELAPDAFEVEFSDDAGRTYATLGLRANQLLVLHYRPLQVA